MIYLFHILSMILSIFFWVAIFSYFYANFTKFGTKTENAIAIFNNLQLIILIFLSYYLFPIFKNTAEIPFFYQFFHISSLDFEGHINILVGVSIYISLTYNLIDIFIQIFKMKWVFVLHHASLFPFFIGYLYGGYFAKFQVIYAFLEISSCSYNLRQIFTKMDIFHKIIYLIIRTISTPLLIYNLIEDFFNLPIYFAISSSISVFLITIFNCASIYISFKNCRSRKEIKKE